MSRRKKKESKKEVGSTVEEAADVLLSVNY